MAEPDPKSIYDNEPDEPLLDALADAEIEAGQFVAHERVGLSRRLSGQPPRSVISAPSDARIPNVHESDTSPTLTA